VRRREGEGEMERGRGVGEGEGEGKGEGEGEEEEEAELGTSISDFTRFYENPSKGEVGAPDFHHQLLEEGTLVGHPAAGSAGEPSYTIKQIQQACQA